MPSSLLYALAALSGLLQVLIFPAFSFYPLAALALAPLIWAAGRARTRKQRFFAGWISGIVFWAGSCYWIYGVMHEYAYLAAPAAAAILVGFSLAKALNTAFFALLAGPLLRRWYGVPAIAAAWTALEGAHQYLGFTWLHLGNAAISMKALAPLAPYTGVYGPSFVLALLNAALAAAAFGRPRRELLWLGLLIFAVLPPRLPEEERGSVPVRLVQPNVHPNELIDGRWTRDRERRHLERMVELSTEVSEEAGADHPELLVWPEYTVPAYFFDSPMWNAYAKSVAREIGSHFVFNTIAFTQIDGRRRPLNSAVVLNPEGEVLAHYSKNFLVPFGEFVPWPFSLIIDKVTLEAGDFAPGREVVVAPVDGHQVGVFICYESAFTRGVRRFTAAGAEVLINISNDSWYGRTAARYQHLLIARMRAIENQRWILRATSDGITTIINRAGQISPPLPSFREGVLNGYFDWATERTWYVRFGQWFLWLTGAITIISAIMERRLS